MKKFVAAVFVIAAKAQVAYPKQLVETQDLRKVDAISYWQFVETANIALSEAVR